MASVTWVILFCLFASVLIELNCSAPTGKVEKTSNQTKTKVGSPTPWTTKFNAKTKKIFDDYKKIIVKKLKEVHNVSNLVEIKPDKTCTQVVAGINYNYLVKLPTNKYAYVSILDRTWKKDHYGKEENVQIRTQTYDFNEKVV